MTKYMKYLLIFFFIFLFSCAKDDDKKICSITFNWELPTERIDNTPLYAWEIDYVTLIVNGVTSRIDPFILTYTVFGANFYQIGLSVTDIYENESDYAFINKGC